MTLGERALFLRQMALLYNSGSQLSDALTVVRRGQWSPKAAATLEHLENALHFGRPLSRGMRERPESFDSVTLGLIRVGEETGSLHIILERLADLQEKRLHLRRQLKQALIYPAFIALSCFSTLLAMMAYFVPKMASFISSFKVELSPLVSLIFTVAGSPWTLLACCEVVVMIMILGYFWVRTETGYAITSKSLLRIPFLGPVLILADHITIASGLGQTQTCGYPLTSALPAIAESLSQPEIAGALVRTNLRLINGEEFGPALDQEKVLGGILTQLLRAGDEAARIPQMCHSIVSLLEEDLKHRIETFTSLLEPMLVGVMGLVVGATVLVLFLPMAKIMQQL